MSLWSRKYPLLQFPLSLTREFKIFDLTELDRATSLHPLYNQLTTTALLAKVNCSSVWQNMAQRCYRRLPHRGCSVDKLCMLRSQPSIYMTLEISTCNHPVAGDLICTHRFICHLHANDSLRYYFRPVSLCPNNDPSQPQISALTKLGHILSLHKTCKPLIPLPAASKQLPVLTLLELVGPPPPRYHSPLGSLF